MRYLTLVGLTAILLMSCTPGPKNTPFDWNLRQGMPKPQVPADNPITQEKIALGRHLFYDKNLSANQTQSCASCHLQANAFAEPLTVSVGSTGESHRRNSLALVNIAYNKTLTWAHDGITSIERQVLLPMFGEEPIELGITGNEDTVLSRINNHETYKSLSLDAFGTEQLNFDQITQALASFVRSLISFESPYDKYAYDMDDSALNASQLNGLTLFMSEKLECHHCHGGFNLTQSTFHEKQPLDRRPFHNTGLFNTEGETSYPKSDTGLYEISLEKRDVGRFRAPTLRNIEVTAPYMHDGSIKTLDGVIDFYAAGGRVINEGENKGDGRENPLKSQFIKGFEITAEEKQDLINFLRSLTDQTFLTNPAYADPWKQQPK